MSYTVEFTPAAERAIERLPADIRSRVLVRITGLADEPRPPGSDELKGNLRGLRKLRVGAYRVAYDVDDATEAVTVWFAGHRRDFYDHLRRTR